MSTIKKLERLQRLHFLILQECTGTPLELSEKLGCSERSVYNLLDQLKDLNAQVSYGRSRKTYFYKNDFSLQIKLTFSVVSDEEVVEVMRGSYLLKNREDISYV
ncbi:MAG: DNA-binding protein [Flavobacteriaceae bacterium]